MVTENDTQTHLSSESRNSDPNGNGNKVSSSSLSRKSNTTHLLDATKNTPHDTHLIPTRSTQLPIKTTFSIPSQHASSFGHMKVSVFAQGFAIDSRALRSLLLKKSLPNLLPVVCFLRKNCESLSSKSVLQWSSRELVRSISSVQIHTLTNF